ncbi:MAG: tripartite tricarboxylate transporter substrate binding protein [Burkholderiales bacterium]
MNRIVRSLFLAAATAAVFINGTALAQYPAKPVRVVVPYPPGGGTDILGRPLAQKLSEKWGQPVLIENRGGATGMIGAEVVAKAPPDGYTVLLSSSPEIVMNLSLYPKMAYDPVNDLVPVTLVAVTPLALTVHPAVAARSLEEYLALARTKPGQLAYSSSGNGGPHHVAGGLLGLLGKVALLHVPYKGGGPQIADLLAGHTASAFLAMPVAAPHIRSGKIRALAVTTAERSTAFPEVPTMAESGLAGFDVAQWYGMFVPRGTPAAAVEKLNADAVAAINLPDIRPRMLEQGYEPVGNSSAQFSAFVKSEVAKYRKIIQDAGIRLE